MAFNTDFLKRSKKANEVSALHYAIIELKSEKRITCNMNNYIKHGTIHKIFGCPMGIIPKVRNTIRKRKMKVLGKQFGANGVGLCVKRRLDVLYVQHLVDQAIKLAVTCL